MARVGIEADTVCMQSNKVGVVDGSQGCVLMDDHSVHLSLSLSWSSGLIHAPIPEFVASVASSWPLCV